ncbi:Frigida-like [Parasponia andersonii]|uniref:FRIGIDA-like protein n=1 Tax=Parasponia andersonii TaxID=3476 RepID=A0A2P5B3B7_PARAD|nr:Frigida-like [Parasponia andersonii]
MATTLETISEALQQIDSKKEKLKKAFEDLQIHSSLISSFALTWSDLDSHFTSLQTHLTHKFQILKAVNSKSNDPSPSPSPSPNPPTQVPTDPSSSSVQIRQVTEDPSPASEPENQIRVDPVSDGVGELVAPRAELVAFCEKMDGSGLRKYVNDTMKERNQILLELPGAIRRAPDPGVLILGAMEGFYRSNGKNNKGGKDLELTHVRRSCVLLLEQLMVVCPNVGSGSREKAKNLALEWKENMSKDGANPLESLGFLHLVAAYGLVSELNVDELLDNLVNVARYQPGIDLCRKLGLVDKVEDLINKFVSKGKHLSAVIFSFEFELTEKFPPVPLLKAYVKQSKKISKKICKEGQYSLQSLNESAAKEISILKSVIRVIEERKLESEYPQELLVKRITQLEQQKADRKRSPAAPVAKPKQLQHQLANRLDKGKQKQHSGNKRPLPDAPFGPTSVPKTLRAANSTVPSYKQPHLPLTRLLPKGPYVSSSAAPYGMLGLVQSAAPHVGSSAGTYGLAGAPTGFPGNPGTSSSHLYAAEPYVPSGYYDRSTSYGGYGLPPQYHPSYYPQ